MFIFPGHFQSSLWEHWDGSERIETNQSGEQIVRVYRQGVFYLITPYPLQYFSGGAGAEGEIARYLDKNRALTKLGYNFTVASFRTKVDAFIMRNIDYGGCGM